MTTALAKQRTPRAKEFEFPVTVDWIGGRHVLAKVDGKEAVEVAPPPVFRGTDPSTWSPEDFFVAAAASCLAVTFTGLAERDGLTYDKLKVEGTGVCGQRDDGRFGFTRLVLHLELTTAPDTGEHAKALAEKAETTCLVAASLDVPVETAIDVKSSDEPVPLDPIRSHRSSG